MRKAWLCAVVLLAGAALAQQPDFSKVQIKITKVAGTVYLLQDSIGDGGNIAASIGEDGIVLVDDEYAALTGKVAQALNSVSNKPVRLVISTHFHGDHIGGNAYFQQQGPVIAQENVRARMQSGGRIMGEEVKPTPKEALPIITFNDRATVHLNGEDIRIIHFPRGHTDGDAIVFFPQSKVVHMGDEFVTYGFPFIDIENGGGVRGMIAAIEKVIATVPPDTKIIPGHGDVATVADLKPYLAMLKETTDRVENGIKQGKTLQRLQQENVLAGFESWGGPGKYISTNKFIETLYNDLKGSKTGESVKHN